MATQKRTPLSFIASALAGLLVVGAVLGVSFAIEAGFDTGGSDRIADQASLRTVVVTDSVGREVTVPAEPQHIAAFDAFSGNVCVLSGAGDALAGAPGGVLSNVLLQQLCPELPDALQLSGDTVNIETLMDAQVDVAFVRAAMEASGAETAKLDKMGIPYVVVDYETVPEQIEAIELVGRVCGESAFSKASDIAEYYRSTVDDVQQRVADIPEDQRLRVYHSINDVLLTDGADSLGADWIGLCGLVDVSAGELGMGSQNDYTATLEQIYAWAPDLIVCNTAAARSRILQDVQWSGLKAVTDGNVHNLPVSTSRWGQRGDPETFLGMLWLGKVAYPERFTDIDLERVVSTYYSEIIGLPIDNELWLQILAGEGIRDQGNGSNESGL